MKEIKSKVQPNYKECSIWIDLNEDPHGSVKKHWNGTKWVKTSDDIANKLQIEIENIREQIAQLFSQLVDLKTAVDLSKTYKDNAINEKINKLNNRVNELEQFIITD